MMIIPGNVKLQHPLLVLLQKTLIKIILNPRKQLGELQDRIAKLKQADVFYANHVVKCYQIYTCVNQDIISHFIANYFLTSFNNEWFPRHPGQVKAYLKLYVQGFLQSLFYFTHVTYDSPSPIHHLVDISGLLQARGF